MNTLSNLEIDAINNFFLYKIEATQLWVRMCEEKIRKSNNDMENSDG
jgi:hypothetical protein